MCHKRKIIYMASIRLPENIETKLEHLCEITQRSKSFYIKEALERYLEDVGDQYIAIDRISRPKRKTLSTKEVLAQLAKGK